MSEEGEQVIGYFDRTGARIERAEFERLHMHPSYSMLAHAEVMDVAWPTASSFEVTTSWVGVVLGDRVPKMFETTVHVSRTAELLHQVVHETEQEALAGHADAISRLTGAMADPVVADLLEPPQSGKP